MARRLRYSERKRLAEAGSLGDLAHNSVPDGLRYAVDNVLQSAPHSISNTFFKRLKDECIRHFGDPWDVTNFTFNLNTDDFLDFLEIAAEVGSIGVRTSTGHLVTPLPDIHTTINALSERHRFGYRMEQGEMHKIGSPALEVEVVGPTLLAIKKPGWEEVERSYREALGHQLGGETDDALTAANAAVEAALKAVGMKGNTLKDLAQAFKSSGLVPGYLETLPSLLEDRLDRLHAARSTAGDAHGKAPGAPEVPQPLADLAIHWAGAFIVYLSESAT